MRRVFILIALIVGMSASVASAVTFDDFMKEIRKNFLTAQGKAKLFGFSNDFAYGEMTEGSFSPGNFVVIKGKGAPNVPVELYEDAAFGEVESVKGKIVKIYINKRFREIPKEGIVVGLNKIYVNLISKDDISVLYPFFLAQKEITVLDRVDDRANLSIHLQRQENITFSYRVVETSTGRVIFAGNLNLTPGEKTGVLTAVKEEAQSSFLELSDKALIAYDSQSNKYWILTENKLSCFVEKSSCDTKKTLQAKGINMFADRGNLVIWLENGKSILIRQGSEKQLVFDGFLTQGSFSLFDLTTKNIYDINERAKILLEDLSGANAVYYYKDNIAVAVYDNKLSILENKKIKKDISLKGAESIKIKDGIIYIFSEHREKVPLAGDYITMNLQMLSISKPEEVKSTQINQALQHFDIDEVKGEIIFVKKDGTINRIKL